MLIFISDNKTVNTLQTLTCRIYKDLLNGTNKFDIVNNSGLVLSVKPVTLTSVVIQRTSKTTKSPETI